MRHSGWGEDGRSGRRGLRTGTESKAKLALKHMPRLVVLVVHVQRRRPAATPLVDAEGPPIGCHLLMRVRP